jgi:cellulose synthase operon protein C
MSNLLRQGTLQEAPLPPLAVKATEALRLGDFKQAIELFKRLVKQDARPEWCDALGEAYTGRARFLAAKGMFEEAETALSKAAASDGTVPDPLLYVQCLVKRGQIHKAAGLAVKYIGNDRVAASAAPRLAELAAALWLAAPVPLAAPADQKSEFGKWVEHAAAAQESLTAWIEGRPPQEIDQSLSRIPLRSAFGSLRLILKSLLTAPDDPARARLLLGSIPPESAFASLRLAVEAALPEPPVDPMATPAPPSKPQQVFAGEVRALPGAASQSLVQLAKAERSGPGALLSFLASQAGSLPADDVKRACLDLLPQAPHRLRQFESTFGPLSEFDRNRVLALAAEAGSDWERAEQCWAVAAQRIKTATGAQAGLTAGVIYRHLARLAHEHPEIEGEGTSDPEIEYLELSLRADPDHLHAVLELIGLYRTHEQDRDWHRLAEDAAQRFPGESAVLLQAVDSAIARKAFKKAVGFARKLLALDPINQAARQRMIELHISHARKQLRSKRADLASKELAGAAEWERPGALNSSLRINQGLLGLECGHMADAEERLRQGVDLAGGGVPGWLCASLEHALMNAGEASARLLREELTRAQKTEPPTKEGIRSIVSAMSGREARESKKAAGGLIFRIRGWLLKGSVLAWSAAEFHPIAEMFGRVNAYDVLGEYAKAAGRRDPAEDATWRYYRLVARSKGDPDRLSFAERDELFEMEEAAARRRDFHAVNRIERFLEGGGPDSTPRRRSGRFSVADFIDFDDDAESICALSELLATGLEDTPPEMVKGMVEKLGQRRAATALADRLRASPLGSMPETLLRRLAKGLVESVIATNGGPKHE